MVYPEEATSAFAFETITVATAAIGFTAATYQPTNAPGATRAICTLETAPIRYRTDGTDPTASVGHLVNVGDVLTLEGLEDIKNFRAIRSGGTSGSLSVSYER